MKVLFIGTSHTDCNGMPFQFLQLAQIGDEGKVVDVSMLASPSVTLGWHARQTETQRSILSGVWDYIVFQQETHPFAGQETLLNDALALMDLTKKTKAKPVLMMTWASEKEPENQPILDSAFINVAQKTSMLLAPVGIAWRDMLENHPDIRLFDPDGEHASQAGSYLAACVFYSVFIRKDPAGLPGRIVYNGDELVNIKPEHAKILQSYAWKACMNLNAA
ncbi:DUF4886 domain-containing protein [Elusimicrobiota bacterium]